MSKVIVKILENINVDVVFEYEVEINEKNIKNFEIELNSSDDGSSIHDYLEDYNYKYKNRKMGKIWEVYNEHTEIYSIEKGEE